MYLVVQRCFANQDICYLKVMVERAQVPCNTYMTKVSIFLHPFTPTPEHGNHLDEAATINP